MSSEHLPKSKCIYDYDNYRIFLRDYYLEAKAKRKSFSYRSLSRLAGFTSPIFIKRLIDGERNLSLKGAEKLAGALRLNQDETAFFKNLVLFTQAKSSEEKQLAAHQMMNCRAFRKIHPLKEAQYKYYTRWYFIAVRELIDLPGFKEDPEWIATRLRPTITPEQALEALQELIKLDLIRRDSTGQLVQTETIISTSDQITSVSLAAFHREMIKKAAEAIDRFPREEREISAVTTGISLESTKKIKGLIEDLRKEIALIAAQDRARDHVYQINFQLFPVASLKERGK